MFQQDALKNFTQLYSKIIKNNNKTLTFNQNLIASNIVSKKISPINIYTKPIEYE